MTVFEASDELGGQFRLAARIPGKEDYAATPRAASAEFERYDVDVRLGVKAGLADLRDFDGVVLATGVTPRRIDVPGVGLPHVLDYERAIRDGVPSGTVAIIGGGGIGVDTAAFLVEHHDPVERAAEFGRRFSLAASPAIVEPLRQSWANRLPGASMHPRSTIRSGNDVTILRRSGKFGAGVGLTMRWVVLGALRDAGVRMVNELTYHRITPEGVEVEYGDGTVELIPGQNVVVCAGQEAHNPLESKLADAGVPYVVVGGARDARRVDAVRAGAEGIRAGRTLAP